MILGMYGRGEILSDVMKMRAAGKKTRGDHMDTLSLGCNVIKLKLFSKCIS